MSDLYNAINSRFDTLKTYKDSFLDIYEKLAKYYEHLDRWCSSESDIKQRAHISTKVTRVGMKAVNNLITGLAGSTCPKGTDWFKLDINETNHTVLKEVYSVVKSIHLELDKSGGGFYHEANMFFKDLTIYGTAVYMVDEVEVNSKREIVFQYVPLEEVFIDDDMFRKVSTVYRRVFYTVKEFEDRFGKMPEGMSEQDKIDSANLVKVIHAVVPIGTFGYDEEFKDTHKYMGYLYQEDGSDGEILETIPYLTNPFIVARWSRLPKTPYGTSIAMLSLYDVMMVDALDKQMLVNNELINSPPLGTTEEFNLAKGVGLTAGALVHGAIDPTTNRPRIQPILQPSSISTIMATREIYERNVDDAFLYKLLIDINPQTKSAQEVIQLIGDRTRALYPAASSIFSEFLEPVIHSVYILLKKRSKTVLPELEFYSSEKIPTAGELGTGKLPSRVVFNSSLADVKTSTDLSNLGRFVEYVVGMSNIMQGSEAVLNLRTILDKMLSYLFLDPSIVKTEEEFNKLNEDKNKMLEEMRRAQLQAQQAGTARSEAETARIMSETGAV